MSWNIISAKEINNYMDKDNVVLIDLRDEELYKKKHIPNSVNVPVRRLKEQLKYFKDYRTIILYCEHGNLSLRIAKILSEIISDEYMIYSVYGGITAYEQYNI